MSEVQKKDLFGVIVDGNFCFVPGILKKSSKIVQPGEPNRTQTQIETLLVEKA